MIAPDPNETIAPAAAAATEEPSVAPSAQAPSPDAGLRHVMIAEMAFFIAEARGFEPGREFDDWLAAEREIDLRASTALK